MNKNLGLQCSIFASIFYILINVLLVFKLPEKLDTFLVFSWVTVPGIIGGLIFYRMDKKGLWRENDE
ncbi:MAG: hypothetical protein QM498_01510 [Desulfobacterium sp.]